MGLSLEMVYLQLQDGQMQAGSVEDLSRIQAAFQGHGQLCWL